MEEFTLKGKNGKLYPRIYITTISLKLSEQLLELFRELNLKATKYSQFYPRGMNRKITHIVVIRGVEIFHKFMEDISPKNPKHIVKYEKFLESQKLINSPNL
jgi:hypothetical protein